MNEVEEFCKEMKKDYSRMRQVLLTIIGVFGLFTVVAFGNNMVLQHTVKQHDLYIQALRKNTVTYEDFILFNRTYELQLEYWQAIVNGDEPELARKQREFNELRSMITIRRAVRSGQ